MLYQPWSDLTHGNAASFAEQVRRDSQGIYFAFAPPTESATALKAGFQSFIESFELLNSHLQLQKGLDISNFRQQYVAALQT
jgi:hypothetical protein